jgi:hypothetical protein
MIMEELERGQASPLDPFDYDAGGHRDRRTLSGGANNDH